MKSRKTIWVVAALLVIAGGLAVRPVRQWRAGVERLAGAAAGAAAPGAAGTATTRPPPKAAPGAVAQPGETAAERFARVDKIRRDYDEIRTKMSADFTAAGAAFPGGVSAFLRQLALLEREWRADIAKVLPGLELEDYEMRETITGKALEQNLAGLSVPEETRRTVFRLRREFDEQFALVFDVTPLALLERERMRQALVGQMRGLVDEATFGALLRVEDPSFAGLRALAAQQGWPPQAADGLWRVKNDYILRKLEIQAQIGLTAEQRAAMQAALAAQTRSRVGVVTGSDAILAGGEALGWLPLAK